ADDPRLTVRHGAPTDAQPLRVVMGTRELSTDLRVLDDAAPSLQVRTRDPRAALKSLYRDHGRHHVLLEGGPALAAALLRAGRVDEVGAYWARAVLGAGATAVGELDIATVTDAMRLHVTGVETITDGTQTGVRVSGTFKRGDR